MPVIDTVATGNNIKTLVKAKGIKVTSLAEHMGFGTPQAVYKWFKGTAMPTLDNLVVLANVLDTTLDKIVVTHLV